MIAFSPQICHKCGATMIWDIRPMTLCYERLSATFDMPGWYCACGEGAHSGEDMEASDRQLNLMKAQVENLTPREPDAARRGPPHPQEAGAEPAGGRGASGRRAERLPQVRER